MRTRGVVIGLITLSAAWMACFSISTSAKMADPPKEGVVVTTQGQRLEGEVTETRESVTVVRRGVTSVFPREDVTSIDYSPYSERFEAALAALKADDLDGRLELAREAFERREYALAQRAVDQAIDLNPLSRPAMDLSRAIANQITLEGMKKRTAAATAPTTRPEAPDRVRYRGLSADQINLVRQFELRKGDQVRIQFRNNARKAFVDSQPGLSFRDFNTLTDVDQALQILQKGSPDIQRDILVMNDPESIRTFGRRLSTAIVQGCATSACHGGTGETFRLLSGTPDPSTLVTNFYLVTTYHHSVASEGGNPFGSGELWMIDRTSPRDSLLYQYALPRALAKQKHPEVRNWNGLVGNESERFLVDLENWITHDLPPKVPDYGFSYSVEGTSRPTRKAATSASTQPATQPME